MTTQTPAEALARVEKPLGEVLSWLGREPALYFRGFPHTFEVKEGILLTMYEAEQLKATLARAVEDAEWRPIETCPYRKRVLLFCPTNEGPRINATWVGMRHGGDSRELGYDEAFHLDTPYTTTENGIKKIVTCPIEDQRAWPTYWKPIDPPTADTARRERA